jgi:Na+-driven multidrug efflux pump
VGNSLGEGRRREAVRYAYASEFIAIVVGFVLFCSILIFSEQIVGIFNSDPELT